jgi:hypothetical protein
MSSFGFARIVVAAALTAFWSRGREGTQRMLDAVAELAEDRVGDVERVLRHEEHADALAADQPHDELDALEQHLRRLVEEQVRFVEEEDELGLVEVADFGSRSYSSESIQSRKVAYRRGLVISLSAARMLTTPCCLPEPPPGAAAVCMKSAMSSIGSPKNLSPPWALICIRPRWIAPTLAALTLP